MNGANEMNQEQEERIKRMVDRHLKMNKDENEDDEGYLAIIPIKECIIPKEMKF